MEDVKETLELGNEIPKERESDRRWEVCEWEGWVWVVKI
jgi:hypothetical protein